ncbi:MAG: AAA family ATPase, partial [Lachnospiraceae bacterium]|nr:AAA family ATPase [Lachnospiraceae bacterium]
MKLIQRKKYNDELAALVNIPDIKVITGIRRSGKSKLMDAMVDIIKKADPSGNIIHINFNLTEFEDLLEYHKLESYIENEYSSGVNNYVLIDEI